jgi:hypothetical protein
VDHASRAAGFGGRRNRPRPGPWVNARCFGHRALAFSLAAPAGALAGASREGLPWITLTGPRDLVGDEIATPGPSLNARCCGRCALASLLGRAADEKARGSARLFFDHVRITCLRASAKSFFGACGVSAWSLCAVASSQSAPCCVAWWRLCGGGPLVGLAGQGRTSRRPSSARARGRPAWPARAGPRARAACAFLALLRRRAWPTGGCARWPGRAGAAAAERLRAGPWTGQLRSPASPSARRACRAGCDPFLRGRTRRPPYWGVFPGANRPWLCRRWSCWASCLPLSWRLPSRCESTGRRAIRAGP